MEVWFIGVGDLTSDFGGSNGGDCLIIISRDCLIIISGDRRISNSGDCRINSSGDLKVGGGCGDTGDDVIPDME